jgi:hypothetical protein
MAIVARSGPRYPYGYPLGAEAQPQGLGRSTSTSFAPGQFVTRTAKGPQKARKRHSKANVNKAPRFSVGPRKAANTGENPQKRWALWDAVCLCSLLFDGFGDRKVAADGALRSFCGRVAGRKIEPPAQGSRRQDGRG